MVAIAPFDLVDAESTPVTHTFNPIQTNPPTYRENGGTSSSSIGESELTMSIRRADRTNQSIHKARITLRVPIMEVATGTTSGGYDAPPAVAYYLQANVEMLLPARSTAQQRENIRTMMVDLLADNQVTSLVDSLESPY